MSATPAPTSEPVDGAGGRPRGGARTDGAAGRPRGGAKPGIAEFDAAFFEAASRAWRANKWALPAGMFQRVVRPVTVPDEGFPGLFS